MQEFLICPNVIFSNDCKEQLIKFLKTNSYKNILLICHEKYMQNEVLISYLKLLENEEKLNISTLTTIDDGLSDTAKVDKAFTFVSSTKVDCIIVFGKNKLINRAKLLSIKLNNHHFDCDDENVSEFRGVPLIVFPTSIYCNSYANSNIIHYDNAKKSEHMYSDKNCMPVCCFLDKTLIKEFISYTSDFDCLFVMINLLESYLGKKSNKMTLFLTLNGISLFFNYINKYIKDKDNDEYYDNICLASYISNITSENCNLGLISAFTRNYSSSTFMSYTNTFLKYFKILMNFNKIKANKRIVDLAYPLNIDVSSLTQNQIIEKVISRIYSLVDEFSDIKTKEQTVDTDNYELLTKNIFSDSCIKNNIRLIDQNDIKYLIKNAE